MQQRGPGAIPLKAPTGNTKSERPVHRRDAKQTAFYSSRMSNLLCASLVKNII
jgi:hypothetical protein